MTEDTPTLTEILHLERPPGHSFQRPKKPIPKLKGPFEVVRCECGTINTPASNRHCYECGMPLTEEAWIAYDNQVKEHQYIDDLMYLDRYYPELYPPRKNTKIKPQKNQIAPCPCCQVTYETVLNGKTVDYCPNCGEPVSEKTLFQRHWLLNHPTKA